MRLITLCSAALLMASAQAHAFCRDDLQQLKPRIDRIKNSEPDRYLLASRWWGQALEAEKGSELECRTFLARARKALLEPLEGVAGCEGPNAYLPRCAAGSAASAASAGATAPYTPPGSVTSPHIAQ